MPPPSTSPFPAKSPLQRCPATSSPARRAAWTSWAAAWSCSATPPPARCAAWTTSAPTAARRSAAAGWRRPRATPASCAPTTAGPLTARAACRRARARTPARAAAGACSLAFFGSRGAPAAPCDRRPVLAQPPPPPPPPPAPPYPHPKQDVPSLDANTGAGYPKRPIVESYPIEERGGYVWLFYGSKARVGRCCCCFGAARRRRMARGASGWGLGSGSSEAPDAGSPPPPPPLKLPPPRPRHPRRAFRPPSGRPSPSARSWRTPSGAPSTARRAQ